MTLTEKILARAAGETEVNAGDTLCVIEAMKIFNQVDTEITGIVRKIFKHSGDPVEFGEPLFLIESLSP
mgnify:CR=1 FL=1